tara:strand:+ start:68 stop:487 length:420 start_codon:yes stop_codon:yes gene_type:complete
MKKIIFFLLIILTLSVDAQEIIEIVDAKKSQNSFVSKIAITDELSKAREFAEKDIQSNSLFLIVPGGIAPKIYDSDFSFKLNYDVSFMNFGCELINEEVAAAYNTKIFGLLTEKYGINWLKEIREDVIGLTKYSASRKN